MISAPLPPDPPAPPPICKHSLFSGKSIGSILLPDAAVPSSAQRKCRGCHYQESKIQTPFYILLWEVILHDALVKFLLGFQRIKETEQLYLATVSLYCYRFGPARGTALRNTANFGPLPIRSTLCCSSVCREEQQCWWRDEKTKLLRGDRESGVFSLEEAERRTSKLKVFLAPNLTVQWGHCFECMGENRSQNRDNGRTGLGTRSVQSSEKNSGFAVRRYANICPHLCMSPHIQQHMAHWSPLFISATHSQSTYLSNLVQPLVWQQSITYFLCIFNFLKVP